MSSDFIVGDMLFVDGGAHRHDGRRQCDQRCARYRLGVDVGGTHTDLVLLDAATGGCWSRRSRARRRIRRSACSTASRDFIARGVDPASIEFFSHGTTITTNALLEMRGARVGLLITKGFRAVQEAQSQARDGNLFDYFYARSRRRSRRKA